MRRGASLKLRDTANEHPADQAWSSKMKGLTRRRAAPGAVFLLCMFSLIFRLRQEKLKYMPEDFGSSFQVGQERQGLLPEKTPDQHTTLISSNRLRSSSPSMGWRASSAVRTLVWPPPSKKSNGFLVVRCNGGLNQQRGAICNAVLVARIMNATLVLPELDTNSFWHDKSGFSGIYDVDHFITSLANDVKVVKTLPEAGVGRKRQRRFKPFQLRPPRDASPTWYKSIALAKMRVHGAIYLTPFSHRLAEDLDNHEYQRLRCRVNFHALRFREDVMNLSSKIVARLRAEGQFLAIHLRFEMDMLAFAGSLWAYIESRCVDIFPPKEQAILVKYRKENFAEKTLNYTERRLIGKCPLTPEEVGLLLRSLGYDSSTRIYLAAGSIFGGEHFLGPLRSLFPHIENRTTIATPNELRKTSTEGRGSLGPAVDYMVCLLSDIFMPTYDGPSNFANNLLGHRLYYAFRRTIRPDRKALAPLFIQREEGLFGQKVFETEVRKVMEKSWLSGPHVRVPPESFYTNPFSECFCKPQAGKLSDRCPGDLQMLALEEADREGSEHALIHSDTVIAEAGGVLESLTKDSHKDVKVVGQTRASAHQGKDGER